MSAAPFLHTPVAPRVPTEPEFAYQRWFRGRADTIGVAPAHDRYDTWAQVYRDGQKNVAEIRLNTRHGAADFTAQVELEPAALRELAQRLLDAACDIEAAPAAGSAA